MDESPLTSEPFASSTGSAETILVTSDSFSSRLFMLIGRSLFPISVVLILAGTFLWGPWVTLVIGLSWFGLIHIWG